VNRDNYFLFTPMLHEVAAGDLDVTTIVNPLRKLLRRTRLFVGSVDAIDAAARRVTVSHVPAGHAHHLPYDHLVVALGVVTHVPDAPGLRDRALTMRSLGDALALRNQLLGHMEEADFECNAAERGPLLTVVVAGGGFAGVETVGAVHDFLHEALPYYPNLRPRDLRVVLVHPGAVVLPELGERLGRYAQARLAERGVEVALGTRVAGVDGDDVALSDGRRIAARTLVWTAGSATNPALRDLPCATVRGRVTVDAALRVPDLPGVWALGDCAHIPDSAAAAAGMPDGAFPPTAQHALREGRVLARNLAAVLDGRDPAPFAFKALGAPRLHRAAHGRGDGARAQRLGGRGVVALAHRVPEQAAAVREEAARGARLDARRGVLQGPRAVRPGRAPAADRGGNASAARR
jgi:NADH dehydrogenase